MHMRPRRTCQWMPGPARWPVRAVNKRVCCRGPHPPSHAAVGHAQLQLGLCTQAEVRLACSACTLLRLHSHLACLLLSVEAGLSSALPG